MQIAKIGVLLMVAGAQGNSISGTKPGFNVPWNLGKQTPTCWKLKDAQRYKEPSTKKKIKNNYEV